MRRLIAPLVLVLGAGCGGSAATTSTDVLSPPTTSITVVLEMSSTSEATATSMTTTTTTATTTTPSNSTTTMPTEDAELVELLATGLGIVSFGTVASVALTELAAVLGPPSNQFDPVGEDIVREARWDALGLTVILQFDDGAETFAGWVHQGAGTLSTDGGLTVGDTVQDVFSRHGAEAGAVQHLDPAECGPEWSIVIDDPDSDQIIRAILDGPDDTSTVTRMEAGTVFWC